MAISHPARMAFLAFGMFASLSLGGCANRLGEPLLRTRKRHGGTGWAW